MKRTLKSALVVAGLMSFISLSAHAADRMDLTSDTTINGLSGITTTQNVNGGAIANAAHHLTITGDVSNNTLRLTNTSAIGGALYQEFGILTVGNNVKFENNKAIGINIAGDEPSAGAIYMTGTQASFGSNVTFANNSASTITGVGGNGGAMYIKDSNVTIDSAAFNSNTAGSRGGAFYTEDSTITITNAASFDGNSAGKGGAIHMWDSSNAGDAKLTLGDGSSFTNNRATTSVGGAISSYDGNITLGKNTTFSGNSAKQDGGAIYNVNYDLNKAELNIKGGTTFSGNTAGRKGGAIYTDGTANLDSTDGSITFTSNKASGGGLDVYLDGASSNLNITGSNAANKVSFGSGSNSIAGAGTITQNSAGTVEFINNKSVNGFSGKYIQTNGKTSLNNSAMFNNFDIQSGKLELLNGSTAAIDGANKKFAGSELTINGQGSALDLKASIADSTVITLQNKAQVTINQNGSLGFDSNDTWEDSTVKLNGGNLVFSGLKNAKNGTLTAASGNLNVSGGTLVLDSGSSIAKNTNVTLADTAAFDINGATVYLDSNDNWNGSIDMESGSLTLDGISHNTSNGNFTQSGGTLNLNNNSNLDLTSSANTISGGQVNINAGNTLNMTNGASMSNTTAKVDGQMSITGGSLTNTTTTVNGSLNVSSSTITGGSTTISGTSVTRADNTSSIIDSTVSDHTINVNNGAQLDVTNSSITNGTNTIDGTLNLENNSSIAGGTTTVNGNGTLNVNNSSINADTVLDLKENSTLNITNGGSVVINGENGSKWNGSIINNDSTLTLNNVIHNTVDGSYNQTNGSLILNSSELTIGSGSSITNGDITLNDSDFTVANGGNVSGGTINVDGTSDFVVEQGGVVSGGTINFDENTTVTVKGTVEEKAKFDINTDVLVDGGSLTLNKTNGENLGDSWTDGALTLQNNGVLNFKGLENDKNGQFYGESGKLIIDSNTNDFVIEGGSYIKETVNTEITNNGTLIIGAADDTVTGANVVLGQGTKWNGAVKNQGGNLVLNNVTKGTGTESIFTQTSGTTTVTGNFAMNNDADQIVGGTLNIGTTSNAGRITQTGALSEISEEVSVNLEQNSTLDIQGGSATLNGSGTGTDSWKGSVLLSKDGSLNLKDITQNGILQATGGTLNIADSSLAIGQGSIISKDANVDFAASSSLNITNGGSAAFDNDEWKGDITLNGGRLDHFGTTNGNLKAESGILNTAAASKLTIGTDNYIKDDVAANILGELDITGTGFVSLNSGDTLAGNTTINDTGILNLGDYVNMSDSGQSITFTGSDATMNLLTNENLNLKADLIGTDGQINKEGSGDVLFSGSTGQYSGDLTINNSGNLTFVDAEGFGGNLIFGDIAGKSIGIIADTVKGSTTLDEFAEITYSTYRDVDLVFGKEVSVSKGTINALAKSGQNVIFNESVKASNGGKFFAQGESVYFNNQASITKDGYLTANGTNVSFLNGVTIDAEQRGGAVLTVNAAETAFFNDVSANNSIINSSADNTLFNSLNMANSDMFIARNGFAANSMNLSGLNNIHLMNGTITDNYVQNLTLENGAVGNVSIDISPRDWTSDRIITAGISTDGTGTLNVSDFQFLNKCPIDRHIPLQIFSAQSGNLNNINFTATDKTVFTPIGWYKLFPHPQGGATGLYNASLVKYNPQVFRGQVATVANYQNQLVVNNILFDHMQEVNLRYMTAQKDSNKYAAAYPQFAPYQYSMKNGGLWFKAFGTFEKLSMSQNLNVNNNFYGGLVGADFPAIDLENGWTLMPTAYIAYTGAHQTFANMGMYQNGGQAGGMATFMKNDFIGSVLAYGGGYFNQMDVAGYSDDTGNWYAGTAAKAAYNFHPTKHFVIQPTVLASYNLFGEQRWHTDFGDMSMRANMLNGINVAPGVNFIYGRETWSIYATFQYFYNIMGYSNGRAGNVALENVDMRHGFLEYGIGATKTWKDRFSGYVQVVLRNGGRTGVGFQGGLMYKF